MSGFVNENWPEALRDKLREMMNNLCDEIATGGCSDFPEYKQQCGIIHGLAIAERELLDLVQQPDDEDDDEFAPL